MSTFIENIELDESNEEFNQAFQIINQTDKLVYLTGKAGTGKTTFLKYVKEYSCKNTVILAPTGVAAVNAGGQTIHSFFQIPFGPFVPHDKRLRKKSPKDDSDKSCFYTTFNYFNDRKNIIMAMELLVIDEISMVRCDLLDVIDQILRIVRNSDIPFGGTQVLLIGDTFQLPPIADVQQWNILEKFYDSPYFFSSRVIKECKPIYIELKKIYRQKEQEFIDLLNRVRVNEITSKELDYLNNKYNPNFESKSNENYITLATHNNIVTNTNLIKLKELKGELYSIKADIVGRFPGSILPTDQILQLKEGAQIMFVKNGKNKEYFNGKIASIKEISEDSIRVKCDDGQEILVNKRKWENIDYEWNSETKKIESKVVGTFTQYPLKLAWAITVHKSQGLTFDKVIADLSAAFSPGQVYVALSRCTSYSGLILKSKINRSAIKTDSTVLEFAKNETPNTLLVKELNSGKADVLYKESRNYFKSNLYLKALESFIKALRFRDDLATDSFKRYFELTINRLSSYKIICTRLRVELNDNKAQLEFVDQIKHDLQTTIEEYKIRLIEDSESLDQLKEKYKNLETLFFNLEQANEKKLSDYSSLENLYKLEVDKNQKNVDDINANKLLIQEGILKLSFADVMEKNYLKQIKELQNLLADKETEILRLNKLGFFERLFGVK